MARRGFKCRGAAPTWDSFCGDRKAADGLGDMFHLVRETPDRAQKVLQAIRKSADRVMSTNGGKWKLADRAQDVHRAIRKAADRAVSLNDGKWNLADRARNVRRAIRNPADRSRNVQHAVRKSADRAVAFECPSYKLPVSSKALSYRSFVLTSRATIANDVSFFVPVLFSFP